MTQSRLDQAAFDDWLSDQPPEAHQLLKDVRDTVIASGHNLTEGIKWGSPCYWLPGISRRNIIWFQHHNNYVRLGSFNGVTMPDRDNLLEGTGIRLRHIKVYKVTDSNRQTLTIYVRASTDLAIADPDSLSG